MPKIKPSFSEDEFGPFIIQLFKSVRHCCMISAVGNCNGWLNEKFVFKKFDVIAHTVSS